MKFRIFFVLPLFFASIIVKASVIQYNGFYREYSSNIVNGNNLEWLMWDVNNGKSIFEALRKYSVDGWMLANESQIISLYDSFGFRKNWGNSTNFNVPINNSNDLSFYPEYKAFFELFGTTAFHSCTNVSLSCNILSSDPLTFTNALFSSAPNSNTPYKNAIVRSPFSWFGPSGIRKEMASAALSEQIHTNPYVAFTFQSVALVRPKSGSSFEVSSPSSFFILTLGLITLLYRKIRLLKK